MQVIEMPSFLPWTSWELYKVHNRELNSALLVEAVWLLDIDAEKFRDPMTRLRYPQVIQPTISVRVSSVAEELLLSTVSELGALVLPADPGPAPLVIDGTSYEIAAGEGFAFVRYHLTDSPPERWLPLHDWASRWIAGNRSNAVPCP